MNKNYASKKESKLPLVERDISWMYFNHRILQEAQRTEVPLLERMSFLGIYSNNLDEFFRVRVATLSRIAESKNKALANESDQAKQTIHRINKLNDLYAAEYAEAVKTVTERLEDENICLLTDKQVDEEQKSFVRQYFFNKLNGTTLPIWMDKIDELTSEEDDIIYLAIKLTRWTSEKKRPTRNYAVVKVPVNALGRFLQLPDKDGKKYLMYMDDVVRLCLPWLFAGLTFNNFEAYAFKFTKDAEMEMDNDLNSGKMQKVQRGVKSRKKGEPLRVIYDSEMPKDLQKHLFNLLKLDRLDSCQAGGRYHNHKDLMKFPDCGRKDLKYPEWNPINLPEFNGSESIFSVIRKEDRMIHVPYHSFNAYLRFLEEAAISPEVKTIKITLYRLAKDSKVVETLIAAAKNKKKVIVVIELLARFDEASNIYWSKKMQDAGIQVIFGVEGLKIHSKITWIQTLHGSLSVIGTGNFHEGNAKAYTDCMLFTASKTITKDVEHVFDFIQQPFIPVKFKELLVSPNDMKNQLIKLINNEINNHRIGKEAWIKIKINHITDTDIIKKLYQASSEGIPVDLVLRGNCALMTDIPGLSDNIRIHGIIDRYLEHSRILIFANGGDEKCYIGSADWMPRNLNNRIEVMAPVYNAHLKHELKKIVDYGLLDTKQGRIVDGSGKNILWKPEEGHTYFRSQEGLYNHYLSEIKNEKSTEVIKNKKK